MFHHNHLVCEINPQFEITLTFNSPADKAYDNCDVSFTTILDSNTRIRCYGWSAGEWVFVEEKTDEEQTKNHLINFTNLSPFNNYRFDCYAQIDGYYTIFNSKSGWTPPAHEVEIIE